MSNSFKVVLSLLTIFLFSCQDDDALPKPKAYLALKYPDAKYYQVDLDCAYSFKINSIAKLKNDRYRKNCWYDITYPLLDGSIYISYYPVEGNLRSLITDAQKLPLSHETKADAILSTTYINDEHQTYGLFYEVEGNAASQAQFYLTDSLNHFATGSIYFNAKPNYDSLLPAADYLKKDMRKIMESMKWKD
jgi:gliding motility-associated lipoprotein GldD